MFQALGDSHEQPKDEALLAVQGFQCMVLPINLCYTEILMG